MPGAWRRWRGNWASGARRSIASSRNTGWKPWEHNMLPECRNAWGLQITPAAPCLREPAKPIKFNHCAHKDSPDGRTDARMAWCGMVDDLGLVFKRLLLGAVASVSLLSSGAFAYETVVVNGVEATRILIAPPKTELATTIRDGLRAAMADASGSREQADADRLYYFYGARHFEPLWLNQTDDGIVFSDAAEKIVSLFEKAHLQGLD